MPVASLLLLTALCAPPAAADAAEETARRDAVARLAPAKARQVDVLVGEKQEKAVLREEPLLRWSNPTAGSVYGEVFVWSHVGRPAAIASIYRWYHPFKDSTLELVSTSTSPVIAREGDEILWEPKAAGVKFSTWDAPPPANSAGARLTQMRRLARRFSATLIDQRAGEPVQRELRLLNQPAHRYESSEQNVIDGTLFALVEVTDPEVWIILEAVKRDEGLTWQYSLARMNSDACEVRLDNKPVQNWEWISHPWKDRQASYTTVGFKPEEVPVRPAEKASPESKE